MNRLASVVLICFVSVGCGKHPRDDEDNSSTTPSSASFQEDNAIRTLEWVGRCLHRIDQDIKPGNEPSKIEAREKRKQFVVGLEGKRIRWQAKIQLITADRTCHLESIEWEVPAAIRHSPTDFRDRYVFDISPRYQGDLERSLSGFLPVKGEEQWLLQRRGGDTVFVTGTIRGPWLNIEPLAEWKGGSVRRETIFLPLAEGRVSPVR
jgi:hypothetical protein